ncbi:hypothetical protein Ct61P_15083 [Colletotrichum tofieldiae]|nr:hypothetical protein Ct61P_15083 [Colletotrichum tofieldiae]
MPPDILRLMKDVVPEGNATEKGLTLQLPKASMGKAASATIQEWARDIEKASELVAQREREQRAVAASAVSDLRYLIGRLHKRVAAAKTADAAEAAQEDPASSISVLQEALRQLEGGGKDAATCGVLRAQMEALQAKHAESQARRARKTNEQVRCERALGAMEQELVMVEHDMA